MLALTIFVLYAVSVGLKKSYSFYHSGLGQTGSACLAKSG